MKWVYNRANKMAASLRSSFGFPQNQIPFTIRTRGTKTLLGRENLNFKAAAMDSSENKAPFYQNVIVMRHGDRLDNFDPAWVDTAERPWDPPLTHGGFCRAFSTGHTIRTQLGFPIHRVFVSPFLRCVQTASEVVAALCAVDANPNAKSSTDVSSIDPSRVEVSIENGLCEMLSTAAIRLDVAPKDGIFRFDYPQLEAMLPSGTLDPTVAQVYKELPQWGEKPEETADRYKRIVKVLADKYPSKNLLLVTHGEGVGVSVYGFSKDTTVVEVDYCAYSELRRSISWQNELFTAGDFEVLTKSKHTGVTFYANEQLGINHESS